MNFLTIMFTTHVCVYLLHVIYRLLIVISIKNKEFIFAFGENLKKMRIEAGLSQENLANDADIPLSQVGRIERGEINTTISTVYALATALNTNAAEMFKF